MTEGESALEERRGRIALEEKRENMKYNLGILKFYFIFYKLMTLGSASLERPLAALS